MKRSITILALLLISVCVMGQTSKKDSIEKASRPKYQPNASTIISIKTELPAQILNSYLLVVNNGGPTGLVNSQTPSNQVQALIKQYQVAVDSLTVISSRYLVQWDKEARKKFTADSLKKYK